MKRKPIVYLINCVMKKVVGSLRIAGAEMNAKIVREEDGMKGGIMILVISFIAIKKRVPLRGKP